MGRADIIRYNVLCISNTVVTRGLCVFFLDSWEIGAGVKLY